MVVWRNEVPLGIHRRSSQDEKVKDIPEDIFEIVTWDDVQPTGMSFSQQSFDSSVGEQSFASTFFTFSKFLADDAEREWCFWSQLSAAVRVLRYHGARSASSISVDVAGEMVVERHW
jgi:hypothetical protein